jgi:predicted  nucleic acid-binding Zn-ribbon protein
MSPHEEFLVLGAAAASGELTQEERRRLDEHLAVCAACRASVQQLQATILTAVPAIAPEVPHEDSKADRSWSADRAEARLLEGLDREERDRGAQGAAFAAAQDAHDGGHRAYFPSRIRWDHLALTSAAMALFALGLGVTAYRSGQGPVPGTTRADSRARVVEEQLADAGHEARRWAAQVAERDQALAQLREQMQKQLAELQEFKGRLGSPAVRNQQAETSALVRENEQLREEAQDAEARYGALQKTAEELQQKRSEESGRAEVLEARVAGLSEELQGQQQTITRQQEYLEHDRDIRELMGARDLYIAEIYDVERTGQTNKPYGRVFYTRGKSLVFYAYDLDQQAGLKAASTFQAWGRRGASNQQAMNLGVFYEDSAAKKRWVLRSNDAETLEELDAVFVTIEPQGGSPHPSTEPLLFAYLRVHPNHR